MGRPLKKKPISVPVTLGYDDQYHAYIQVGVKGNGKAHIAHRQAKTREECEDKIRLLEERLATGTLAKPGRKPTVGQFLTEWLQEGIGEGRWRYHTHVNYEIAIRLRLGPQLGHLRLDLLNSDHVRQMMAEVKRTTSVGKANNARAILASALTSAVERGLVMVNVARAEAVRPFKVTEAEVEPLTMDEATRIRRVALGRPGGERREVALGMGLRQGEYLGLRWARPDRPRIGTDVNLETGVMTIREKLLRRKWQHGCADPVACARPHCRTTACQPPWEHGCATPDSCRQQEWRCPRRVRRATCSRHTRPCPKPCKSDCKEHASVCPQRRGGGLTTEDPKSAAGGRSAMMPDPVWEALRRRKTQQDRDRLAAGDLWEELGLVFTTKYGRPIDPRDDWEDWCDTLKEAGVPHARIHDARHTCATFLLAAGVPERTAMEIMGWASRSMAKHYQHVVDDLKRDAARRMGAFLPSVTEPEPTRPMPAQRDRRSSSTDLQRDTGATILQFPRRAV